MVSDSGSGGLSPRIFFASFALVTEDGSATFQCALPPRHEVRRPPHPVLSAIVCTCTDIVDCTNCLLYSCECKCDLVEERCVSDSEQGTTYSRSS